MRPWLDSAGVQSDARLVWRDLSPTAEIGPGVYLLELAAPDWVLNPFVQQHDRMLAVADALLQRTDRRVRVETGGVQWSTVPGTNVQRRTLVLQLRILRDDELPIEIIEAGISPRAVWSIVTLVGILAVIVGVNVGLLSIVRLAELAPDAIEDGARAAADVAATVKLAAFAAVAYVAWRLVAPLLGGSVEVET